MLIPNADFATNSQTALPNQNNLIKLQYLKINSSKTDLEANSLKGDDNKRMDLSIFLEIENI